MAPTEPQGDGGYGWVIVLSSFTATFLGDGVLFSFGLVLNVLVDEFKETTASVSVMGGLLQGCVGLSAPLAGSLSDTYGRRYVTIVGAVMFSSGLFISSFASDVRMLYFTYGIVNGLGFGLMFPPPFASVMENFNKRRGIAQGIALAGSGITNTPSRIVVGWLGRRSCINQNMMLKCILFLVALLFITSLMLTTFQTKLIFAAMYGTLYGSYFCTVPLVLADAVGVENSGKTMGLFVLMLTGANIFGTPLAAWTVDATGDFVVCFILAGSETLVACFLLMLPNIKDLCSSKELKSQTTHL